MRRVLFALMFCLALPAAARDFYVDPAIGSDTGDGSTEHPWRTLQAVLAANKIESRDWASKPPQAATALVTVHAGAPVKGGDTIWLRSGYHGAIAIQSLYNAVPITIAAQPGHTPRVKSVLVQSAQNWKLRGLSVSPSYATPNTQIVMVAVKDHGFHGPAYDVDIEGFDVFSVEDATNWTVGDWIDLASDGIDVQAARVNVVRNRIRNVRFGIGVDGADARIRYNLVDGFSADGMRGLGDGGVFEYNRVQNAFAEEPEDPNHDDGFQSWSVGPGGVGTGEVRNVVLRGNVFINSTAPHPLRAPMQGIGCFDGFFVNWTVENNVVVTDHWHGITFLGMRDSRIVNNTTLDNIAGQPGPPWIMVNPHKNGQPSSNVLIRNNLATDYDLLGNGLTQDHNVTITAANASTLFVAPPYDLHLRATATAAIDTGSAASAPALDADGVPRPQGAGIDLGAYERCDGCIFRDGFEAR